MEGCLEAQIIKLEELKTINEKEYVFFMSNGSTDYKVGSMIDKNDVITGKNNFKLPIRILKINKAWIDKDEGDYENSTLKNINSINTEKENLK